MKRLIVWTLLLLPALAQPLPEALRKGLETPGVANARLDREGRARDLARTLEDPLRTPLSELQARQALELAEARLQRALAQAENEILAAYLQALEASLQVGLAAKAVQVADLALRATEIRVRGGGATPLELLEAQNRLLEARSNLEVARRGEESAQASLENLLGPWRPEGVAELPPLPQEDLLETLLRENVDLLQLKQSLELLSFQRGLLDETFTPRREIEALEEQIQALETSLDNLERSLGVGLRARYAQLGPLLQGAQAAAEAYRAAQERYAAEERRFRAGLTSQLALLQQELALLQAQLALAQARHAYLRAYYGLLASR
ncbi:TolC family protein [Thermus sediminis]|uniref:TolC family protein n=1 Tax=Thermus sediminis TaxID=1761908 RepID=UPI000E3C8EB2|nr:TolC family protein [Thermus sediminis]